MLQVPRSYHSPARQQQAQETRAAILRAARSLFSSEGFSAATIDKIARAAGYAVPTVYALFGSKRGIVEALLAAAPFGEAYAEIVERMPQLADPAERLQLAARIARTIHEAERAELEFLRGAGAISPEAAVKERECETIRFARQKPLIDFIAAAGRLKRGLDETSARQILWALTSRDLFRLLVVVQGWSEDRYEDWLGRLLIAQLLEQPA